MSLHIIDCEDRELRFRPDGGKHFRCFYVVMTRDEPKAKVAELKILVSVQPDRTVQMIKANAAVFDTQAASDGETREDWTATWLAMLQAAFNQLRNESVTAVYVLDDEADASWTAALVASHFVSDGCVHQLQRSSELVNAGERPSHDGIRIEFFKARSFGDLNGRVPQVKQFIAGRYLAEQVIRLLQNTIQNSEDCLLRTQVRAEDVLALFACNPSDLQMLLAVGADGPTGILIGDDSDGLNSGHIEYLGVHSDSRRQSLGSLLLNEFQARIPKSDLSVAVHARNGTSISFFRRNNFCLSQQYRLWTRDIGAH